MLFLALRQLFSRKKQTILTLFGIILGTAAYVAISGMMLGFQTYIVDQLVNNDAYIRITAREELIDPQSLDSFFFSDTDLVHWKTPPSGRRDHARIEYPNGWFDRLDADPLVVSYSPQLVLQGLAKRNQISRSIRLVGVNPDRQARVTNIGQFMIQGKFKDIGQSGNRVLLGEGLKIRLGAHVGETVILSTGRGVFDAFKVVGVFRTGVTSIDESTIYGALADFQKLNQTPSQITDIAVRLSNVELATDISNEWSRLSRDKVQSWAQANSSLLSVFKTQDIIRNFMTISILVVAGFGIYNILNMLVNQKKKEIGILRSMGYEPRDILNLFLSQGIFLGSIGGAIGILIGYMVCLWIASIEIDPGRLGGGKMMVVFLPSIYIKGFSLAFGASLFASFLPARAAGRMNPIAIIRSEAT